MSFNLMPERKIDITNKLTFCCDMDDSTWKISNCYFGNKLIEPAEEVYPNLCENVIYTKDADNYRFAHYNCIKFRLVENDKCGHINCINTYPLIKGTCDPMIIEKFIFCTLEMHRKMWLMILNEPFIYQKDKDYCHFPNLWTNKATNVIKILNNVIVLATLKYPHCNKVINEKIMI